MGGYSKRARRHYKLAPSPERLFRSQVTTQLTDEQWKLLRRYADTLQISISEAVRRLSDRALHDLGVSLWPQP
jgi:uncharacterized protein YjiS (DUF1127 family)